MNQGSKRRVAHVGLNVSKKNKIMKDVVADIMRKMDENISDSKLLEILNSTPCEGGSGRSNLDVPSVETTQPILVPLQQKKFRKATRHPLMEKAQKSKNYIRHNRSMPKPRAHLGGLDDSPKRKVLSKSVSLHSEKVKASSNPAKVLHSKSNDVFSDEYNSDVSTKYDRPVVSTDSESEFETFMKTLKHDTGGVKVSKKKKVKSDKKCRALKLKKCTEKKITRIEDSSNDDSSVKSPKIHSKPTATNRRRLSDSSNSSDIESNNVLHQISGATENKNVSKMNTCDQKNDTVASQCKVRIERNPLLDETAMKLTRPTLCSTMFQESKNSSLIEHDNETASISDDDDCLIVCEVPTSKVTDDSHVADKDAESSIQILNVVSLGECQEVTETNNGNSYNIDFEKLKEAIEITQKKSPHQEEIQSSGLKDSNPEFVANTSLDSVHTTTDADSNRKPYPPLATDDREIVDKAVLKNILSYANNGNRSPPDATYMKSIKYEDLTEPTAPSVPTDVIAMIDKKDLESILLRVKSESNEILSDSKIFHSSPCSSSFTDNLSSSNSIMADSFNTSALKDIISTVKQFTSPSKENAFNDSDELDIYGATCTRDLSRNQSSQNILQLLQIRKKILQDYDEIKDSEKSLIGLQNLQSSLAAKTKHIATVIEHIIESDPCFHSTLKNNQETVVNYSVEETLTALKNCVRCGKQATIYCDKCEAVYYCSITCGEHDWNNGHYQSCQGVL